VIENQTVWQDREWDLIVVGTGMGGATLGRAMAEKGWSVLFLEKGRQGFRPEQQGLSPFVTDPAARLVRGLWPDKLFTRVDGHDQAIFAPLGCGAGGSSVFYAGTLERPEPRDLDTDGSCAHPTGGWPFGWHDLLPWLEAAESMYGVRRDPQSAAAALDPPASAEDTAIIERLRLNGLNPYRLGSSVRNLPGCLSCLGVKCPRACKMDARSAGLEPALATGRAELLDQCDVVAVHGSDHRISHVEAIHGGQRLQLKARHFALAAGALNSPRILLASVSAAWPQGCGNGHGQVGRNLMFHLDEMFVVWPPHSKRSNQPSKSIGLRDFYTVDGHRLGMVQAMGVNVDYGLVTQIIKERLTSRGWTSLARLAPLIGGLASLLLGQAKLFTGLLEDLPYPDNRVYSDPQHPDRIHIEYRVMPELQTRRRLYRKMIRRAFRGMRSVFLTWEPQPNFGHPCGTLRAGNDPRTSVLNAECQVHGIENLFVVDASFFPTSMGVNPSLTIAANALRVADLMEKNR
jgi:choline dehydrogenase-like flavoprotein